MNVSRTSWLYDAGSLVLPLWSARCCQAAVAAAPTRRRLTVAMDLASGFVELGLNDGNAFSAATRPSSGDGISRLISKMFGALAVIRDCGAEMSALGPAIKRLVSNLSANGEMLDWAAEGSDFMMELSKLAAVMSELLAVMSERMPATLDFAAERQERVAGASIRMAEVWSVCVVCVAV